jgi:hypothetical protein
MSQTQDTIVAALMEQLIAGLGEGPTDSTFSPRKTQQLVYKPRVLPRRPTGSTATARHRMRRYGKPARARSGRRARRCAMQQAGSTRSTERISQESQRE